MHSRHAVECNATSRARADEYAATRVSCSGAVRRRQALPHYEDRPAFTRRQAAAITFPYDTLKVRENRVAGAAHEHPRPVLQGPLDSWLSASSVQAEVDKAAKLLALAETPIKIASQVQDHARSLACPPARWHARLLVCPLARAVPCGAV